MTQAQRSLDKVTTGDFSAGGLLNRQQFEEFFREVQAQAQILGQVRFEPVDAPKGQIDKIGVGQRLLRSATEATEGSLNTPNTGKVDYDTEKVELPWEVSMETVEDTIEGEGTADTLVELFANQMSADLEDLGGNGDTSASGVTDENFITIVDGWLTYAETDTDTNTYDHQSAAIDKSLFKELKMSLDPRYRRDASNLRWLMSEDQKEEFKDYLTDRSTSAGDAMLMTGQEPTPLGIPIETPVNWPDDTIMLTPLENLVWIVQRDVNMRFTDEGEAVVRRDLYGIYNLLARIDYVIEDTKGVGLAQNVASPTA
ncbi:P2 family phage major capsid protein [Salinilacihabitans rarus]|uniref:P2 family phage major capsid protein n=1 Tax=Salinilacihabitans rarus TaxID=2961596 RepID=UPI0020C876F2|nr:P2 family phage major capsid protein [Salinilacihabitans rarus]